MPSTEVSSWPLPASRPEAALGSPCELPQRPRDLLCPWVLRCPQGQGSLAPAATHLGFPQVPRARGSCRAEVSRGLDEFPPNCSGSECPEMRAWVDCSSSCHCAWSPEEPRRQPHPLTHTGLLWGYQPHPVMSTGLVWGLPGPSPCFTVQTVPIFCAFLAQVLSKGGVSSASFCPGLSVLLTPCKLVQCF